MLTPATCEGVGLWEMWWTHLRPFHQGLFTCGITGPGSRSWSPVSLGTLHGPLHPSSPRFALLCRNDTCNVSLWEAHMVIFFLKKLHMVTCLYVHCKKSKHEKEKVPLFVSPILPSPAITTLKSFLGVHIDCFLCIYLYVYRLRYTNSFVFGVSSQHFILKNFKCTEKLREL